MEFKDVVGVGQAGLTAVLDEVAKLREPDDEHESAEVATLVEAEAKERNDDEGRHGLDVKELVASVATLAAPVALKAAPTVARKSAKSLMVVALVGAAAGAGYMVWKRRKAAANAELSGESPFAAPFPAPFERGTADLDSPDVVDPEFAKEVDEAADELAEEFVEAVEGSEEALDDVLAEEGGEFQKGIADLDSPDVVDEQFAKEVDEAADALAEDFVESVEEPKS